MKYLSILSLFVVLICCGCNKEQVFLNDLAGEWEIITVDYQTRDGGQLTTDLVGVRLNFSTCTDEENESTRCNLSITGNGATEILLKYNAIRPGGSGTRVLQTFGTEDNDLNTIRSVRYEVIADNFEVTFSGNTMTLVTRRLGADFAIGGVFIEGAVIVARRP
jgi:hypothetical protein